MIKSFKKIFYTKHGYAKVMVDEPVVSNLDNKQKFYITFKIIEGDKFKLSSTTLDINAKGLTGADKGKITNIIKPLQHQTYNVEKIEESIDEINEYLNDHGYPHVVVEVSEEVDENTKLIALKYELYASKKYYINKINISGNIKTKDHVIRREFLLQEGDLYSAVKLLKSEHKLNELDYFDEVKIEESRDENDQINLNVDVVEKSTLNIYFAGGYSTADGPLGDISIKDTNFLGEGYELGAGITKASKKIDIELSLMDPYFLDSNFSAGFSVYKNSAHKSKRYNRKYDSNTVGFSVFSGYDLTPKLLYGPRYVYEKTSIKNISKDAVKSLKDQEGKTTTSAIAHRFTYDNRDSRLSPIRSLKSLY
jgi:outer membrane protein insertion porin family